MRTSVFCLLLLAIPSSPVAAQPTADPPGACELHFWPASSVDTYPSAVQAKGGLLASVLLGGQKRAEGLQGIRSEIAASLDAKGSMLALGKSDLAARLGLQPATLIVHDEPLEERSIYKVKTRRQKSSSPCYSELIVAYIMFKNGSWGGHYLDSLFIFRKFGAGREPEREVSGGGSIKLDKYPAKEGEDTDLASADLNSAFRQGFDRFALKVGRPH